MPPTPPPFEMGEPPTTPSPAEPTSQLLAGRVALVTGGSRGLGRAIVRVLAREGAAVAFNYVKADAEAEAALAELRVSGGRAWAFKGSVLDKEALAAMVRTVGE